MTSQLTGADLEEIDKEVMDDLIESLEEEQKEWFENGANVLPGKKRNPATRLQFYEQNTLTNEKLMVLDPDYRDKRDEGIYPDLLPMVYYVAQDGKKIAGPFPDEMTALGMAQQMGLITTEMMPGPMGEPPMMPPPVMQAPSFWALMLQLGQFPSGWSMFKAHSRDYKNCIEALGRRLESITPEIGVPV